MHISAEATQWEKAHSLALFFSVGSQHHSQRTPVSCDKPSAGPFHAYRACRLL